MLFKSKQHESIADQPLFRLKPLRNSWSWLYGITLLLISITPSMGITPSGQFPEKSCTMIAPFPTSEGLGEGSFKVWHSQAKGWHGQAKGWHGQAKGWHGQAEGAAMLIGMNYPPQSPLEKGGRNGRTFSETALEFDQPWFGPRLAKRWVHQEGTRQEVHPSQNPATENPVPDFTMQSDPELRKWHVDMGIQTSFSKLSSTEQKLDRQLDWPLKVDVLNVFTRPRTPIDRKSTFSLNTIYFALGKRVSDRVIINGYLGFAPGVDRDHQQFLFADLRINFKYSSYLIGLQAEYYPWGFPRYHNDTDWKKRIDASRVYFYSAMLTGYLSAEGAGRYKLFNVIVYQDSIKVRDWIFAGIMGMGWSIPISDRWSIQLTGDYSFHAYRPEEYNGWRITTGLRFRF